MSQLEIFESKNSGEHCWNVSLIDDDNVTILSNITPLAKGVALSTAKAINNKGPDAPFLGESQESSDIPVWFAQKASDGWLLGFTLVSETLFNVVHKPEDRVADIKVIENALVSIKANLLKADIKWNPPEADPAYDQKETDVTPMKGHPGS